MTQAQTETQPDYVKQLYEIDLEVLGRRIRRARLEKKWTQRDLSANLFTSAYLSTLELGNTRPTYKSLTSLAERLDKPLDYFLRVSNGVGVELDEEQTRFMAVRLALFTAQTRLERVDSATTSAAFADDEILVALDMVKVFLPNLPSNDCARYYTLRGRYFNLKNLPDEALAELEEADKYLQTQPNAELSVLVEYEFGMAYRLQHRLMAALTHFQAALEIIKNGPSEQALELLRGKIELQAAKSLILLDQPQQAMGHYEQVLADLMVALDPTAQARLYTDLAALYQRQGDFEQASLYLGRTLEVSEQSKRVGLLLTTYNELAQLYTEGGQYAQAEERLNQSLKLARRLETDARCEELNALVTLALTHQKQGDLPLARQHLEAALALKEACANRVYLSRLYRVAGEIWAETGERARAESYFEQALVVLVVEEGQEQGKGLAASLAEVYHSYSQRMREWGEFDRAFKLMEQAYR